MANYSTLITSIQDNIKQNGQNQITGELLQQALLAMIAELGAEFQFGGVAVPTDNPGTPDYNVAYLASTTGIYSNFGSIDVKSGEFVLLKWNGEWQKDVVFTIVNNLFAGGTDAPLSAEQGKELWGYVSRIMESLYNADIADLDVQAANIPNAAKRLTGNFYLEAGVPYTFKAIFKSQPASGSQVNVWLQPAENAPAVGVVSSLYLYAGSWNTERKNTVVVQTSGMYYISYRYVYDVVPNANILVSLDNPLALRYTKNGALANYYVPVGALSLELIKGKIWNEDKSLGSNVYRLCTPILALAHPHFRISCNYADGYSYGLYRWVGDVLSLVNGNVTEDKEYNWDEATELFVAVRALNGRAVTDADLTACGLSVTMLEDTFKVVPDVDKTADGLQKQIDVLAAYIDYREAQLSVFGTDDNYYITPAGGRSQNANCKIVYVNVNAGDVITLNTLINGAAVISEYDDNAKTYTPRVLSGVGNTAPKNYVWKCVKNGIIALCGRKSDFSYSAKSSYISDIFANQQSNDGKETLPPYYFPYIDNRAADIMKAVFASGRADLFGFVSDVHIPHNYGKSGQLFRNIMAQTPLRKVFYGGDTLPQSILWYNKEMSLIDGIVTATKQWNEIISPVREIGRLFNIRGNHDYSLEFTSAWVSGKSYAVGDMVIHKDGDVWKVYECVTANSDTTFDSSKWDLTDYEAGYNVSSVGQKNSIFGDDNFNVEFIGDYDNPKSCYGFFDNKQAKIRYVVIDTSDGADVFNGTSNVGQGVSATQFAWLYNNAFMTLPAGFHIVALAHIPIQENCSKNDDYINNQGSVDLRAFFHAVQTRGTATVQGVVCDFSTMGADYLVLMYYCGHTHRDFITCVDGYWCISIAGDNWSNEPNDSALAGIFDISYPSQRGGTIYEQAIDVVNVDVENMITNAFRIGIGFDRRLHHEMNLVGVNQTLQIESTMAGEIQWAIFDAVGKVRPVTTPVTYTSNNASIDSDGVVTGLQAGQSVAAAYSEQENRIELWWIVVNN